MSRWNPIANSDTTLLADINDSKHPYNRSIGRISVQEGPFGETLITMSLANGPDAHATHSSHCALTLNPAQVDQLINVLLEAKRLADESYEPDHE